MSGDDSNLSGDIALVPGMPDSKSLSRNEAGCRRLIAISAEASLIEPRSPGWRDSIFASGRSCRREVLLSVLLLLMGVVPSEWVAVPPSSCHLPNASAARASAGCSASVDRKGQAALGAVVSVPGAAMGLVRLWNFRFLRTCRLSLWVCLCRAGQAALGWCGYQAAVIGQFRGRPKVGRVVVYGRGWCRGWCYRAGIRVFRTKGVAAFRSIVGPGARRCYGALCFSGIAFFLCRSRKKRGVLSIKT